MKAQKKKLHIATEQKPADQIIVNKDGKFSGEGRRMDGRAIDPAKLQQLNVKNLLNKKNIQFLANLFLFSFCVF